MYLCFCVWEQRKWKKDTTRSLGINTALYIYMYILQHILCGVRLSISSCLKRCDLVSIHTLFSVVSSGGLVRRAVAANSELGQVCSVYLQRKTMVRMHTYVSLRVLLAFGAFSPLFSLHRHSMVINRNISLLACSCLMP